VNYRDRLNIRVRSAVQTEQRYGMQRQRRAIDRMANEDARLLRVTDCVIAALLGAMSACLFLLITGAR